MQEEPRVFVINDDDVMGALEELGEGTVRHIRTREEWEAARGTGLVFVLNSASRSAAEGLYPAVLLEEYHDLVRECLSTRRPPPGFPEGEVWQPAVLIDCETEATLPQFPVAVLKRIHESLFHSKLHNVSMVVHIRHLVAAVHRALRIKLALEARAGERGECMVTWKFDHYVKHMGLP